MRSIAWQYLSAERQRQARSYIEAVARDGQARSSSRVIRIVFRTRIRIHTCTHIHTHTRARML